MSGFLVESGRILIRIIRGSQELPFSNKPKRRPFGRCRLLWRVVRNEHKLTRKSLDGPNPFATGNFVDSSPAVVNGVLYVGSENGNVYAFGLP
jgi:hypothetical protein